MMDETGCLKFMPSRRAPDRLRLLGRVARAVVDLVANPLAKGVCLLDSAYIQRQAGRSFRGDPRAPSLNPNVC